MLLTALILAATIQPITLAQLQSELRKPGPKATLVNIWASWCDPCLEEMPDLLRFARKHKDARLLLVSADDPDDRAKAEKVLADLGVDFPSYLKIDRDDMAFINGLDKHWSGALPASFLYDRSGRLFHFWEGRVNEAALEEQMNALLITLATATLSLGDKAPTATVKMKNAADGKDVTIATAAGNKGTLVVFTCNHCPFAKAWAERIVAIGNDAVGRGIGVVAINSNDATDHPEDDVTHTAEQQKTLGMHFPYAIDATSEIAKAFGATKTPEAYLFDKDGKLVYHGTIDDNHKEPSKVQKRFLKDAVDALASGKAPSVQETKGLGCSIKFHS